MRETRDQPKRIDLVYPDHSVSTLAWVEPKRLGDDFPLMHIKARTEDGRLFGEPNHPGELPQAPTLIPHELTHALHFSFLKAEQRGRAQDKYAEFILADPQGPFHSFEKRTTAEVAYIEAAGFFGENFMQFMRTRQGGGSVRPGSITPAIQAEFVESEWTRLITYPKKVATMVPYRNGVITAFLGGGIFSSPDGQNLGGGGNTTRVYDGSQKVVAMIPYQNGVITAFSGKRIYFSPDGQDLGGGGNTTRMPGLGVLRDLLQPIVTGGDVEGAVYGAIFIDFASFVGLDFAASSYFEANALTFGQYRDFINTQHPEHSAALEQVRRFWGL